MSSTPIPDPDEDPIGFIEELVAGAKNYNTASPQDQQRTDQIVDTAKNYIKNTDT